MKSGRLCSGPFMPEWSAYRQPLNRARMFCELVLAIDSDWMPSCC
jgi:hypothetical protein